MAGRKIAVLGGGLGALSTAYEIADRNADAEITVYQMGWRLGGKCASARNQDVANRIEEHGIHILFGWYENAFHVLRRVYADLGEKWEDAFEKQQSFSLQEHVRGRWRCWHHTLPERPGEPGDCLAAGSGQCRGVPEMAREVLVWILGQLRSFFEGSRLLRPLAWFLQRKAARACDVAGEASCRLSKDECRTVERSLRSLLLWLRIFVALARPVWSVLRWVVGDWLARSDKVRRLWIMLELGSAAAAGLLHAAAEDKALSEFDDMDLLEWLNEHAVLGRKLSKASMESAPIRMIYEVIFAYEGGDPKKPNLAAGTAVRGLLRLLFDYRGAMVYKMKQGSAETMITPLYSALKRKNVRFEFFHRVDRLELTSDETRIARIHLTIQATSRTPPYDPLINDMANPTAPKDAWPHKPKYGDLHEGDNLKQSEELPDGGYDLESPTSGAPTVGTRLLEWSGLGSGTTDVFDDVVLAIPVGALSPICEDLVKARTVGPRWRAMFDHAATAPTQGVQLWLGKAASELGWDEKVGPALVGAFAQPYGNWADLREVLPHEKWPVGNTPKQVAYLCGPLLDTDELKNAAPKGRREMVRETVLRWIEHEASILWPLAYDGGEFRWDLLVDLKNGSGSKRLEGQFVRANVNPSERYVLSHKASIRHRLAPGDSGFENLYLAGDWTRNGLDVGCVEATITSGRLAARALLGLTSDEMPIYAEHY